MPPTHGNEKTTQPKAHMFDCWIAEDGPGHALVMELNKVKWFLAKLIGGLTLFAMLAPTAVALWMHYHQQPKAQAAEATSLIPQAHAETKGSP